MKRKTKKIIDRMMSVLLALTMIFCLIGCGNTAPAIGEDVVSIEEGSGAEATEVIGDVEPSEMEVLDGEIAGSEKPTATPSPTATPVPTAEPTPEPTSTPEPIPTPTTTPTPELHIHEYSEETITRQPSCSEVGEKTLICSCGDSKTENVLPTGNHNWEAVYQTVVHPSTGHVEVSEVQVQVGTTTRSEYACAFCDARFDTPSGVVEHCKATGDRDHAMARTIIYDYSEPVYEMQTQSQWIVDTPEYTTQELVGYTCSICGATK